MATRNVPSRYATIQAAVDAAIAGDVVNIAAGTYAEKVLISGKTNLTIQGAGDSTLIEYTDTGTAAITVKDSNSLTIKDLKIHTAGTENQGIWVYGVGQGGSAIIGLTVRNLTIIADGGSGTAASGIIGDAAANAVHSGWLITGNRISSAAAGSCGIVLQDVTASEISANTITIPTGTGATNVAWTSERFNLSGLVFSDNRVSGSGGSMVSFLTDWNDTGTTMIPADGIPTTIDGLTIHGNTFSNWGSRAIRVGDGLAGGATGTVSGIVIDANRFQMTADTVEVIGGTDAPAGVFLTGSVGNVYNVKAPATLAKATAAALIAQGTINTGLYEVDPISRIEGHLGVKVSTDDSGTITEADAHGNLWRGFENFLVGRQANDAITFTQRICGVCPVPHGTTSMYAVESVLGVSSGYMTFAKTGSATDGVPPAAVLVRNMVLASEFLMSSITHFYHLAAQSYIQGPAIPPWTPYFPDTQYHPALVNDKGPGSTARAIPACSDDAAAVPVDLWSAIIKQYVKALRIRRLALEAGALFAGRMPMTSTFVAGGTTNRFKDKADFDAKCDAFKALIDEVGRFVISEYIPLVLTLSYLYPDWDNMANGGEGYGAGVGNFLSWGAFPAADEAGALFLKGGYKMNGADITDLLVNRADLGTAKPIVEANLKEVITRSRYAKTHGYESTDSQYPGAVTLTEPSRDDADKYSWLKAPRWYGKPMEVGPQARMVVNGKYFVGGESLVTAGHVGISGAYGDHYLNDAQTGLDTRVLHSDLVAGLAGTLGDGAVAAVGGHILGLKGGLSTMDRLRARAIESFWMVNLLVGAYTKGASNSDQATFSGGLIAELKGLWGGSAPEFYRDVATPVGTVSGFGLTEAPRGALGHFVTASAGKIISYQCVVPTTWNGSPKDGTGVVSEDNSSDTKRGPIEQAMIGVPFDDTVTILGSGTKRAALSGVEVLRVAQSFDPCIACAVH